MASDLVLQVDDNPTRRKHANERATVWLRGVSEGALALDLSCARPVKNTLSYKMALQANSQANNRIKRRTSRPESTSFTFFVVLYPSFRILACFSAPVFLIG